ncbi:MAG TPA: HdeD family acid-resistance protein [Acidobacteriaceae bacterium]|jgi:uncharacterized membrane protein HdeD (DUF308 family)|nr:HdeD family acid-resistance protein [Acidobacteriaceae bacterium]
MNTLSAYSPSGRWSIALGAFLIILGLMAIAAPFLAGLTATVLLGWLVVLAGITHLAYAWSERSTGIFLWQVLIGIAYTVAGFYVLLHPVVGIVALTLVLAFYIAIEGILEIVAWFRLRPADAAAFFLLDGLVSVVLAGLIFLHWPSGSRWILGTFLGVSILMSGFVRLTIPVRRRGSVAETLFRRRISARTRPSETPRISTP